MTLPRFTAPETSRLVEVTEARMDCPVAFKLVVVAFTIVMFVPFAVVKVRPAILVTPEM